MKNYSSKLKILILLILIGLSLPSLVLAQDTTVPETGFGQICSRELGLATCVQRIYIFALGFGSLIALLMLILSGYRYMTAQGNAQQLENAKDAFASAFIGLIILFIAFVLLYLINPDLTRFKNFQETLTLPEIKKFQTEVPGVDLTDGKDKTDNEKFEECSGFADCGFNLEVISIRAGTESDPIPFTEDARNAVGVEIKVKDFTGEFNQELIWDFKVRSFNVQPFGAEGKSTSASVVPLDWGKFPVGHKDYFTAIAKFRGKAQSVDIWYIQTEAVNKKP